MFRTSFILPFNAVFTDLFISEFCSFQNIYQRKTVCSNLKCLLSLSNMHLCFFHALSWLNNLFCFSSVQAPLAMCIRVYLPIYLLKNGLVGLMFWNYKIKYSKHSSAKLVLAQFWAILGKYQVLVPRVFVKFARNHQIPKMTIILHSHYQWKECILFHFLIRILY